MERPLARAIFWVAAAKLAWTQVGYGLALAALRRARGNPPVAPGGDVGTPLVSLIVAAYDEERVIAAKVANALALDWPRDRLEIVVAVDGGADPGADATAERARAAGADLVLELPRGGKVRAQDAAVAAARGTLLAFSDANAVWEPGALRALVTPFADPGVGYVCGQVRFVNAEGTNQEGLYWRYEMWLRSRRVGAGVGDRGQRRDLRAAARGVHARERGHGPRPLVPLQRRQARPPRGLRPATRARRRRWCPRSRARARASGA